MYCEYFGFKEKPFNITPNPRFIFLGKHHRDAFAHLLYGINRHSGFIVLTGEVGTGKTTLLRTLLSQLENEEHHTALIFNPCLSAQELLRNINREFGIPAEGLSTAELLDQLNQFLLRQNRDGKTVVLVIDEAQNFEPSVLEHIRLISNLETETDKLIQIVLAGQPELTRLLERTELRQLGQRITVRYLLGSLDFEDLEAYISHRLEKAGGWNAVTFSPAALKAVYKASKGIPRLINIICDRILLICYTEETRKVDAKIAAQAIRETRPEQGKGKSRIGIAAAIVGIAALLLGMAAFLHGALPRQQGMASPVLPPPAANAAIAHSVTLPPAASPAPPEHDLLLFSKAALKDLGSQSEQETLLKGLNAIFGIWKAPTSKGPSQKADDPIAELTRRRGLQATHFTASFEELLAMNAPVLLEVSLPGTKGKRYLALTEASDGNLRVTPGLLGRKVISKEELKTIWRGKGYLIFKNYRDIPSESPIGTGGLQVTSLQELLAEAGAYRRSPSGVFDQETVSAISGFQRKMNITPDGKAGGQTLLLLYRATGRYFPPELIQRRRA